MVERKLPGVKIKKTAIVIVTGIATLIGTMPVFLFLGRPALLPYSALFALIIATIVVLNVSYSVVEKPPFGAFLLAGSGEVSRISAPCLGSFVIYYLIYGIDSLFGAILNVNLDHIAFYSLIVFCGLGVMEAIIRGTSRND